MPFGKPRARPPRTTTKKVTALDLIKRWDDTYSVSHSRFPDRGRSLNYGGTTVPNFRKVGLETPVILQLLAQVGHVDSGHVDSSEDTESDQGLTVGNLPSALGGVESGLLKAALMK